MAAHLLRLLVPVLLLAAAAPAHASTLAQSLGDEAARMRPLVDQAATIASARPALAPPAIDHSTLSSLQLWGLNASRLAADIDAKHGPQDLACIFRGMAQETDDQLRAAAEAKTGALRAAALRKLSLMLRDAAEVAPIVDAGAPKESAAGTGVQAAQHLCPSDLNVRF